MARTFRLPQGGTLTLNITELFAVTTAQAEAALKEIVAETERKIKEAMSEPKSGRRYRIGRGRRRFHIASAPGEPPAVRTGFLRSNIRSGTRRTTFGVEGLVGSNVVYAPFLEEGTLRMKPRPVWRRVLRESADDIFRTFESFGRGTVR